ncbi:polysaccharide biosynthesis tyrosine autokinase (plasmid) [Tundrisphaera sp. TA3]|uniref:tyrosine-protein kinase domain-containing protein n=1 Tax=Tundrisphaera sp. TA3 TaxID=3435775 RepID=UPI003EB846F6
MQPQLPPAEAAGYLAGDIHAVLGILRRGWRYVAVSAAVCLTLGIIYAARGKVTYQASARVLVLQHGGRVLPGGGDPHQAAKGFEDSLSTHTMIIRSPIIVQRALDASGLGGLPAESVVDRLTVTVPMATARVLQVGYAAATHDEAQKVIAGVISSYEGFLRDNYQKNSSETIKLFVKARDELNNDLIKMEREYLEHRKENPTYLVDGNGRSFISRRLDQWDQESNRAMVRALQLQSQLELGRSLIGRGTDPAIVASALDRIGAGGDGGATPAGADGAGASGHPDDRFEAQLYEVGFQRLAAARLVDHLRSERDNAAAASPPDPGDVAALFESDPETIRLRSAIQEATAKADDARRIARNASDPAGAGARARVRAFEAKLEAHWLRSRPRIEAELSRPDMDGAIREAEADLRRLTAREAALKETLAQVKADRLRKGLAERDQLAGLHGAQDARVLELDRRIARLRDDPADGTDLESTRGAALIGSLEQSLAAVGVIRDRIRQQFQADVAESRKAESGMLAEANLRNNLERQRALFNSVVDQLKHAQIASDFGSVTAQIINPPSVREIRPRGGSIVLAGLLLGTALGAGLAFLVDKLDSRFRTLSEIRCALDLNVLGMIPELAGGQREGPDAMGLICHAQPRSFVSESFKSIRTNFESLRRNLDAKVIVVTSPSSSEGKSTTASNLAISLAHAGRSVLLIDADMRRPTQHLIHGVPKDRGLPEVLRRATPLSRAVAATAVENLDLLPAGSSVSNPSELLASRHLERIIEEMRRGYDVVILDSPPLLAVADPAIIASVVDGIVLVVRATSTCRPDIERAVEILGSLEAPVLGAVINGITPDLMRSRHGYGYGYGYGYGTYGEADPAGREVEMAGAPRAEITDGTDPEESRPARWPGARRGRA